MTDPRVLRSREAFRRALIVVAGSGEDVTIASLCRESQLNRGTFYLHYSDIGELAEDTARSLSGAVAVPWPEIGAADEAELARRATELIARYLQHLAEYRPFYRWVLGPGSWRVVRTLLDEYAAIIAQGMAAVAGERSPGTSAMVTGLLSGAMLGVATRWVEDPPEGDASALAEWLWGELAVHPVAAVP